MVVMQVALYDRDGTFEENVDVPDFYVRYDAVLNEDALYITSAPETQREDLKYVRGTFTRLSPKNSETVIR